MLPPVTSNRVVLVLIRPGLTSLEVVLVQMNFNDVNYLLMRPGKTKEIHVNMILSLIPRL